MKKNKVMLVDDNLDNRVIVGEMLETDYEVFLSENGSDCLVEIPTFQPDVILLDWMMPSMDGIEVLSAIRQKSEFRNIRVIMMTVKAQAEDVLKAWEAGAHGYLIKPIEKLDLMKILERKMLEKKMLDKQDEERSDMESHLRQAQKMDAIGTLAGGIAHDFNNILFPIMAYSEMIKENPENTAGVKKYIGQVQVAAKRAQELVKQILTFSRRTEQTPLAVEVGLILKEALKLLQPAFPANIQIQFQILKNCKMIFADPTQIHQVIINLCTNAKHAMQPKGGQLSICLRNLPDNETLLLNLQPDVGYLELKVGDTGTGIPEDIMENIFEPFFTTKEVGKGTGMGLSVVYGIVKNLGGSVSVKSEVGKGTVFRLYLPVIKERPKSCEAKKSKKIVGGTEKILVVDDEPVIAEMLSKVLKGLGYQVAVFTSCSETIKESRQNGGDLLITDCSMPEMTGVELAEQFWLKQANFPVILMTGYSETLSKEEALKIGFSDYLIKPVLRADLARAIRKALDKKTT
ncbi:MAG: response regulator [Candidatus Magnetomorum sp.]|nr:response regulator [Candidatus Magnetomorum sp.]